MNKEDEEDKETAQHRKPRLHRASQCRGGHRQLTAGPAHGHLFTCYTHYTQTTSPSALSVISILVRLVHIYVLYASEIYHSLLDL